MTNFSTTPNPYTQNSIASVFLKTALPIVLLTSMNGLLTVVDAIFLGVFVGADGLTAVTLMFPISMLLVAVATMISTGMASELGRLLGAGNMDAARQTFAGAHGLSILTSLIAMALFVLFGWPVVALIANGSSGLGSMGHIFLAISVFTSPVAFLLAVHSDALRTEGRVGFMAIAGLLVSLANMGFNYALIVWFGLGVAGSAAGTALAQALALLVILIFRRLGKARLNLKLTNMRHWRFGWTPMLALGVPRSLSFIGIALGSAATIAALRLFGAGDQSGTIAAYGVVFRLMTFAFFPLLGMALAMQAMVGNNQGAGLWQRSNATLKLALFCSLAYSTAIEIALVVFRDRVGGIFVDDPRVVAEVAGILPVYVALYFSFGPMLMISNYFQAIGDVRRSALLALSRTYLFAIPLTFALPPLVGERGIWLAAPVADLLLIAVTAWMLVIGGQRLVRGIFKPA
ncbi:MAG: MATE family efflux transporter [Devosia sp.]